MKQLGWFLVLLLGGAPSWGATKITVQQLNDLLVSLHEAKKTDAEVAAELSQVELTEELTAAAMNSFGDYIPGGLSSAQMYVLEAHSAVLAPPASDLPSTAAPDEPTAKAILDRALDYAATIYAQLPHLTAVKTTLRFQEDIPAVKGGAGDFTMLSVRDYYAMARMGTSKVVHFANAREAPVVLLNGAEEATSTTDNTHWGRNGQIALFGPGPVLSSILHEAQTGGKISWLRWERVHGMQVAVYAFEVGKKATSYAVDYCCFLDINSVAEETTHSITINPTFKHEKATVPYHGEVFVEPETGVVVRLIVQAEFKPSGAVRQEDRRIDYAPVTLGTQRFVVPVREIINTEAAETWWSALVSGTSSTSDKLMLRNTFFVTEYKDYRSAEEPTPPAHK